MRNEIKVSLAVFLLGTIACEPVIAIGWREIFIVFILIAFLFGPPIYRFIRRLEKFLKSKDKSHRQT